MIQILRGKEVKKAERDVHVAEAGMRGEVLFVVRCREGVHKLSWVEKGCTEVLTTKEVGLKEARSLWVHLSQCRA